jgi:hypothetical protein
MLLGSRYWLRMIGLLTKIDVEGVEYEVLQGLKQTLTRTGYVALELSRRANECLKLLKECGFTCEKMKFTIYYKCCKTRNNSEVL